MTRQYNDLMVDIETLGTTPDALILSIGAVFFDRKTRELGPKFHQHVMPATDMDGQIDADTVLWWLTQSDEARKALKVGQWKASPAGSVLCALATFTKQHCDHSHVNVWSLPAAFDLVILDSMHRRHRMSTMWNHWQHRCLRTVVSEQRGVPVPRPKPSTAHDALADAIAQAHWLMELDSAETPNPAAVASVTDDTAAFSATESAEARMRCETPRPEPAPRQTLVLLNEVHVAREAATDVARALERHATELALDLTRQRARADALDAKVAELLAERSKTPPKEPTGERYVKALREERDLLRAQVSALTEQVQTLGDKLYGITRILDTKETP